MYKVFLINDKYGFAVLSYTMNVEAVHVRGWTIEDPAALSVRLSVEHFAGSITGLNKWLFYDL